MAGSSATMRRRRCARDPPAHQENASRSVGRPRPGRDDGGGHRAQRDRGRWLPLGPVDPDARDHEQLPRHASGVAELVIPGGATADALAIARAQPGITAVAARTSVVAHLRTESGQWKPLLLFVDAAGDDRVIATVKVERRALPAPSNGIVLERTALAFLGVNVGDTVEMIAPGGRATSFTISASAHDGGVAPAEQEQTVYGYGTTATMVRLGLTPTLDNLAIVVGAGAGAGAEPSGDAVAIKAAAERLGAALGAHGIRVDHIDVPRPLAHPHQNQMDTVSFTLLAFGLAALLLSSILVATISSGSG